MKLTTVALHALLSSTPTVLGFEPPPQQPLHPLSDSTTTTQPRPSTTDSDAPTYRHELVSLHKDLVDISSVTYDEEAVGYFLADYLKEHGFVTELQSVPSTGGNNNDAADAKPRFNVLAWPGNNNNNNNNKTNNKKRSSSPKVLVTSHIDTVPPFFPYSRSDDEEPNGETMIGGRGSVDAKAAVAAQIIAVRELLRQGKIGREGDDDDDVMLLYVVGEERAGDGMRHFSDMTDRSVEVKAAIFGEPTEGKLACGHKGFFGCTITAKGKAAHSGYPWLGKSATEMLMRALIDILDTDLGSSERFGNTTVNVGTIEGGVALNVVPEWAVARIAGRVAIGPEEDGGGIVTERVKDMLKRIDGEAFVADCVNGYGVVETACDVDGFETITLNYGTDIHNFKGNHTRYLYGPGSILVAHGPNEAIKLKDMETGVEDYKRLILHVLDDDDKDKETEL
ncbi:Zn-dependent exopeptidase [Poronia punctata]|nr:Zn-dependent exopeptidase [Poronia punctata]